MKIVVAIGGSILLKEYDCKKFQEYSEILKSLASEHEIFVVVGGGKPAREYIGVVRELGAGEAQCDDIGIEVQELMLNCYYLHLEMLLIKKCLITSRKLWNIQLPEK